MKLVLILNAWVCRINIDLLEVELFYIKWEVLGVYIRIDGYLLLLWSGPEKKPLFSGIFDHYKLLICL